jgi:hypothetical protein
MKCQLKAIDIKLRRFIHFAELIRLRTIFPNGGATGRSRGEQDGVVPWASFGPSGESRLRYNETLNATKEQRFRQAPVSRDGRFASSCGGFDDDDTANRSVEMRTPHAP